jgi:hypothetical protein
MSEDNREKIKELMNTIGFVKSFKMLKPIMDDIGIDSLIEKLEKIIEQKMLY